MNDKQNRRQLRLGAGLLLLCLAAAGGAGPRVSLDAESLDLGSMGQNETRERLVTVTNRGDGDLLLSELHASCPCTVPELAAERLAPGESTLLTIRLHSRTFQGQIDKEVLFSTNDPARPEVEISLHAFINAPLLVEPENRRLDFGEVSRGEIAILTADLRAPGIAALKVGAIEFNEELFTVRFSGDRDDPKHMIVRVGLLSGNLIGPFREILRLSTNVEGAETLDLELTGSLGADLYAEPMLVNFRFVKPGEEMRREVKVRAATAGLTFKVTGAEVDLPGLTATIGESGEGGEALVLIAGSAVGMDDPIAKSKRGRFKGKLRIMTDLPSQPELLVDVVYLIRM
jgi:hypothetical protein